MYRTKRVLWNTALYLVLTLLAVMFIFPFLVMLGGSIARERILIVTLTSWIPSGISFRNYVMIFSLQRQVAQWLINSTIISVIPTVSAVFVCSLLGYIFAKKQFRFKHAVFWFLMSAIMVPFEAMIVSYYLVYNFYGWLNRYIVFLVPGIWTAMYMFLMRQYIISIPDAFIEAARIDGAGEWSTFFRIILPLSTPALSTVAIFTFMNSWNAFMGPLTFTSTENMFNLIVGLATLLQQQPSFNMQMTSGVIAFIPMFVVFLVFQRHFIEGIVMSGIKG